MTSAFADPPDLSVIRIRRAEGTIVVRPAPRREPPFDDELPQPPYPAPYDRPLPFETTPHRPPVVPAPPLRTGLPDPAHWARRLLVGVIETAGGRRPLGQLTALLSASVAAGLRGDFERVAARGRRHWTATAVIRSVRASEPAPDVAELCATVQAGARVRAIAMRLEARHGRWCCTRLVLG
jgi:Family of unknown function (DUF6459)